MTKKIIVAAVFILSLYLKVNAQTFVAIPDSNFVHYLKTIIPTAFKGDSLNTSAVVQFRLMDYTGREILNINSGKKSEGTNSERVNIANLASGIYFLVVNINGESQTVRVIKP